MSTHDEDILLKKGFRKAIGVDGNVTWFKPSRQNAPQQRQTLPFPRNEPRMAKDTTPATRGQGSALERSDGYRIETISFDVPGDPVPKARARTFTDASGKSRSITPKRTKDYEAKVRTLAKIAMQGREPFEFSVSIEIFFYLKDRRRRDWDNLAKSVTDAMNGVVYLDDSQITDAEIHKVVCPLNSGASVKVTGKVVV